MIDPESGFSLFQNIEMQIFTWCTFIITPFILVFWYSNPELHEKLLWLEWVVDISWMIEICLNFVTADATDRNFKDRAKTYLSFWFWVDAIATFPAVFTLQGGLLKKHEY